MLPSIGYLWLSVPPSVVYSLDRELLPELCAVLKIQKCKVVLTQAFSKNGTDAIILTIYFLLRVCVLHQWTEIFSLNNAENWIWPPDYKQTSHTLKNSFLTDFRCSWQSELRCIAQRFKMRSHNMHKGVFSDTRHCLFFRPDMRHWGPKWSTSNILKSAWYSTGLVALIVYIPSWHAKPPLTFGITKNLNLTPDILTPLYGP